MAGKELSFKLSSNPHVRLGSSRVVGVCQRIIQNIHNFESFSTGKRQIQGSWNSALERHLECERSEIDDDIYELIRAKAIDRPQQHLYRYDATEIASLFCC